MTCATRRLIALAAVCAATYVPSVRADEGMWLFENPPVDTLEARYGFELTPEWLEHVRNSCVRFSTWGSSSLVSSEGLVLTNHHVGAGVLRQLSTPERDLLTNGFCAKTHTEELRCPRLEMYILRAIEDVTGRVNEAVGDGMAPAEAREAKQRAIAAITEAEDPDGLHREIVTLYRGARYHLYRYQRFSDIRLVMAPESQVAAFGGDTDNFEYPRYALDFCLFRIYEDGLPYRTPHHFAWSRSDPVEGDLVFIAGHPRTTHRNYTVDHLKCLRDVLMPARLNLRWRREVQLLNFSARSPAHARAAIGELKGVQNRRKATTGAYAGLLDAAIMAEKIKEEKALRDWVAQDPKRQSDWGSAWDDIAQAQRAYATFAELHLATSGWLSAFRTELVARAQSIVGLVGELEKPSTARRPEYQDGNLKTHLAWLYADERIEDRYEIDRLGSGLSLVAELLGGSHPTVVALLDGMSPRNRAETLVRQTKLRDVAWRKALVAGGAAAVAQSTDPMIRFARTLNSVLSEIEERYEQRVASVEEEAYAKIAAARFARYGDSVYPDATNTLRLAFGVIKGYDQQGEAIPAFTTFEGLYQRWADRDGAHPFNLPTRWLDRKGKVDLQVPMNFVATVDITGGNSGSSVFNRAGELVGVVFDGNIQSLVWDYTFADKQARCVVVDRRAIAEMLRKVCDAHMLADELLAGFTPVGAAERDRGDTRPRGKGKSTR